MEYDLNGVLVRVQMPEGYIFSTSSADDEYFRINILILDEKMQYIHF